MGGWGRRAARESATVHAHHHHGEGHGEGHGAHTRRALVWVLVANALFLVIELAGALAFGSVALLADVVHMFSDVGALLVALGAAALAARPATSRHTYGLGRAEILAAQFNAVALLAASVWLVVEALDRLGTPQEIRGGGVMVVAFAGLVVNGVSALVLARAGSGNLNVRGAFWHMASDALGSFAALCSGAAAFFFNAEWVDPVASLFVTVLVVVGAARLLTASTRVLLDASPPGIDLRDVVEAIEAVPGVSSAHHVHVWTIGSGETALSAHLLLSDTSLHDAQARAGVVRAMLNDRFDVHHATLEVECHPCDEPVPHGADGGDTPRSP